MQDLMKTGSAGACSGAASDIPKWLLHRVMAGRGAIQQFRRAEAALGPRLDAHCDELALALPFLRQVFGRLEVHLRTLVESSMLVASQEADFEERRQSLLEVREELFETYREYRNILRNVFGHAVATSLGIPIRTPEKISSLSSVVKRLRSRLTEERKEEILAQGPSYVRLDFDHHLNRLSELESELAELDPPLRAKEERLAEARRARDQAIGHFDKSLGLALGLFEPLLRFADLGGSLQRVQALRRGAGAYVPKRQASSAPSP